MPDKNQIHRTREFRIVRDTINKDDRSVELSFSSEEPYDRGYFVEILSHVKGAMRTERLGSGAAPLLFNHNRDWQIGVIDTLLSSEGRGRVKVRFSRGEFAEEIFQDVIDGIRTGVSVGYWIHADRLVEEKDGKGTYEVTDWEPFEVSIVSTPADITVGVGRASDPRSVNIKKEITMPDGKTTTTDAGATTAVKHVEQPVAAPVAPAIDVEAERAAVRNAETARVKALRENGDAFRNFGGRELAEQLVASGGGEAEFMRAMRERISKNGNSPTRTDTPVVGIGMSERDVQKFSLMRLLRAQAALPGSSEFALRQKEAGFEIECCQAAANSMPNGYEVRGIVVPFDVLSRGFSVGNPASAGSLVETPLLLGNFIEILRNKMVLAKLGIRYLPGLTGNPTIPRQISSTGVVWLSEHEEAPETEFEVDGIQLVPKTVSARTKLSRSFLQQTAPSVESMVIADFSAALAGGIDAAALFGTGTNKQPRGIVNQPGVGVVEIGANGGALTWAKVVEMETSVAQANADAGNLAYVTNAKVRGALKSTPKQAGQATYIWSDDNTVNGYRAAVTNSVPSNGSKGNGDNLSTMIFGDFSQLIVGSWGGLDILVDPYTLSTTGAVRISLFQSVDVGCRHSESFSVCRDINTVA